jgi:signal transduction histidine kinase
LRQAIAQMEEFSYTVSHDLRAPARSIRGYAKILLEDFGNDLKPEVKDYLGRIMRSGERMDRLILDVLTYSRLGRRELEVHPVSLDKLVSDLTQQSPDVQSSGAIVSIRGPLQTVLGHEPSLAQAVSNLLANAVKFVRRGEVPRVTFRSEKRGQNLRLWVEDNGIGIRPEHQARAFGVFERLHPGADYEGTGIGLAITRKAVEKMGGTVGLESDGVTGSRFWIELPAPNNP